MRHLTWTTSEAVWLAEIDDEHKEIFACADRLQSILWDSGPTAELLKAVEDLVTSIGEHFAHEERLMRAARYPSLHWHKRLHESAQRQVAQYVYKIKQGDRDAGLELVEILGEWLRRHTRVADRMMASHLRNHLRGVGKLTFRAGTKAAGACGWVDSAGNPFDPLAATKVL
jgi:hemerythrin